jgi:hypothetical protein
MSDYPSKSIISRPKVKNIQTKLSPGRDIVFNKGIQIENRYFLIEIIKKTDRLRIMMFDPKISENYSLEVLMPDAVNLMRGKEDYDYLVSLFRLESDEIVLINPKDD